jgi:hypothetical protein
MTFSAEDLDTIGATDEVLIEPVRRDGSPGRRKRIWIVVDGGEAYVRSVRGTDGGWYRAVKSSGAATLHAESHTWPIRLEHVTDAAEIARVSEALRRKYEERWQQPTASMLRDEVLSTTLRVSPSTSSAPGA